MDKYHQFKKRIEKNLDKKAEKVAKTVLEQEELPVKKTHRVKVVPPIPDSPMCYCRREVKNIENAVICGNGIDKCP